MNTVKCISGITQRDICLLSADDVRAMAVSLLFVVDFTWRYEFNYEKEIESRFIFGQFLTRIIRKKTRAKKNRSKKQLEFIRCPLGRWKSVIIGTLKFIYIEPDRIKKTKWTAKSPSYKQIKFWQIVVQPDNFSRKFALLVSKCWTASVRFS